MKKEMIIQNSERGGAVRCVIRKAGIRMVLHLGTPYSSLSIGGSVSGPSVLYSSNLVDITDIKRLLL